MAGHGRVPGAVLRQIVGPHVGRLAWRDRPGAAGHGPLVRELAAGRRADVDGDAADGAVRHGLRPVPVAQSAFHHVQRAHASRQLGKRLVRPGPGAGADNGRRVCGGVLYLQHRRRRHVGLVGGSGVCVGGMRGQRHAGAHHAPRQARVGGIVIQATRPIRGLRLAWTAPSNPLRPGRHPIDQPPDRQRVLLLQRLGPKCVWQVLIADRA
ncbi:hypothetical protein G6F66_013881 [Rhizopus arrhizus]|nr:hypothetical protein G6F66_013881 [Rhizopus arrhizus]